MMMNDQLESLATAEDHHSSCILRDSSKFTQVARSSSSLSFLNFMLGTLPERTWRPAPHGSATLEISSDTRPGND